MEDCITHIQGGPAVACSEMGKESRTRSKVARHVQHRSLLLYVGALAGFASCLMLVVTQLICAVDGSYMIRCGNSQARGKEEQQRYTYSDFLGEEVRRTKINAQDWEELSAASSRFDFADPRLQMVMKLVKYYFEPWLPMAGVKEGFGAPGKAWKVSSVREAAVTSNVMACCLHVRVVDGRVYFRYGQVISLPWRLTRANGFVTFLQRTLEEYRLKHLRLEFFYNTCDPSLSTTSTFLESAKRSNYLVLSNHRTDMNTDVLVPDVLDFAESYMPSQAELEAASELAWSDRLPKLVFRGATTNFMLQHFNWCSNLRVRLHRMTDAYPDLLDARISRWSHTTPGAVWHMRKRDGVDLAPRLNFTGKNAFKYELEMDGALGSTRLCGVLSTDRVLVRQGSPFYQFFDPLLKRGRHFVEVKHTLQDLAEKVVHMQQHDSEMQQMVRDAHREMGWICGVDGRMLALAVVLVKYQGLLEDSHLVEKPQQMCEWGAAREVAIYARDEQPDCMYKHKPPLLPQPGCPTVCSYFGLRPKDWHWLSSEDLSGWEAWNNT